MNRSGKGYHAAKARKRMESPPDNWPRKLDDGEFLGVLQWHCSAPLVNDFKIPLAS